MNILIRTVYAKVCLDIIPYSIICNFAKSFNKKKIFGFKLRNAINKIIEQTVKIDAVLSHNLLT